MLEHCLEAGLASLDHVALDGTRIQANASKHKAMSYGRMVKAEPELASEIAELRDREAADSLPFFGRAFRSSSSSCFSRFDGPWKPRSKPQALRSGTPPGSA